MNVEQKLPKTLFFAKINLLIISPLRFLSANQLQVVPYRAFYNMHNLQTL